eukprot:m.18070 g.18070  ORF g.18070 m.18070 type:complete len:50 (-) comp5261_c0_seq1:70-219(-)
MRSGSESLLPSVTRIIASTPCGGKMPVSQREQFHALTFGSGHSVAASIP